MYSKLGRLRLDPVRFRRRRFRGVLATGSSARKSCALAKVAIDAWRAGATQIAPLE
jgi:hypothetical protein